VRFAREWDDAAYGLDFVQIHSYPDVRYPDRDETLVGRTASDFGLSKPLLIGACPSHPRQHPEGHLSPAYTLADYLYLAREGATSARGHGASKMSMHSNVRANRVFFAS
jgi:hypothetical protein